MSHVMKRPAAAASQAVSADSKADDVPSNLDTLNIDEKIARFQKACLGQSEGARGPLLRKWFSPKEMSLLWGRLNTAVGRSNAALKQKWADLKKKDQGRSSQKNQINNEILALKLSVENENEFAERAITIIEELKVSRENSREGEWVYRGELEQKLGQREAAEHIAMGKYEEGEDHQGTLDLD